MTDSKMKISFRSALADSSTTFRVGVVLTLALWSFGSACASKPQFTYVAPGKISEYKRYERHAQRNFLTHFTRKVYSGRVIRDAPPGSGQATVLAEWGSPEYHRKFRSLENEVVNEWVYSDPTRLAVIQFVNDELIYQGEMTDLELLFLQKGYPDRIVTEISESGLVRHVLHYRSVFWPTQFDVYNLANGWKIHVSEGI